MSIAELLKLDGEDFVKAAYETILSRPGEPEGVENYERVMAEGLSKAYILMAMNRSPEGRLVRKISNSDLFNEIFKCGAMPFIGFPAGEVWMRKIIKIIFKKMLWFVFRYELWNLYFASVLAYEALERVDAHSFQTERYGLDQGDDGRGSSSLPYGVWQTLKELEA